MSPSLDLSEQSVYIIINNTLLFSESETSLMERISSEKRGDILGQKGTKTTHRDFLADSAGDQNDTSVQLHKKDEGKTPNAVMELL